MRAWYECAVVGFLAGVGFDSTAALTYYDDLTPRASTTHRSVLDFNQSLSLEGILYHPSENGDEVCCIHFNGKDKLLRFEPNNNGKSVLRVEPSENQRIMDQVIKKFDHGKEDNYVAYTSLDRNTPSQSDRFY